ncbi:hypothetical protein EYC80_005316 [Monilinia laxa]|uniref:Peptidase C14 caspase domain-containing protein n=1 Tax=Monilinia laxa TaxID=61186 RepID=A0A5N6KJW1_MONLA|nr:hypothetical protein EYC80_005316 [Monilinia laxa]
MDAKDTALAYSQAHVLLLSWHPDDDDLHVAQEVSYLLLEQRPQVQVKSFLDDFVQDHDDRNTLLIVYYAGHAKLGDRKGVLNLTGSTTINSDENKKIHEIVWNSAENIIRQTRSDVLVIFDCCNAGEMERDIRDSDFTRRAFEYISTTQQRSTTKKPGPESFTSALIWALQEMIRCKPGKRFTTTELVEKIYNAPNIPDCQSPRCTDRIHKGCLRRIVLVPLDEQSTTGASNGRNMEEINETKDTLSVQFVFNTVITNRLIKDLSKYLSDLIGQGHSGTCNVLWEGMNTPSPDEELMLSNSGCTIGKPNKVQTAVQSSTSLISIYI